MSQLFLAGLVALLALVAEALAAQVEGQALLAVMVATAGILVQVLVVAVVRLDIQETAAMVLVRLVAGHLALVVVRLAAIQVQAVKIQAAAVLEYMVKGLLELRLALAVAEVQMDHWLKLIRAVLSVEAREVHLAMPTQEGAQFASFGPVIYANSHQHEQQTNKE
jgi:hypothetical protein